MARERYLVGAGEDTIHSNEIVPETGKEKRQNWWFYNKWKLLVAGVCVVLLASFVYSMVTKVNPDYTVALVSSFSMPDKNLTQFEEYLAQYADDRNGDGKTVVSVANYVFSTLDSADYQQQQASFVRFTGDVSAGDSMLFLHNENGFETISENLGGMFLYNDGAPMPDTAEDYDHAMLPWDDVKAFSEFQVEETDEEYLTAEAIQELFETLRLSLRSSEGASFSKDEKKMEYYDNCLAFAERLKQGEKVNHTQEAD